MGGRVSSWMGLRVSDLMQVEGTHRSVTHLRMVGLDEPAAAVEHSLECTQAPVIVLLRREQLPRQLEERHDLRGQVLGLGEALPYCMYMGRVVSHHGDTGRR